MANTAEIRRENTEHIKQSLSDGKEHTARSMAEKTGLSIATCNSILKDLAREGIAVYEERQLNEVGRKTCVYRINSLYDSILYVRCAQEGKRKYFSSIANYVYGGNKVCEEADCEDFSYSSTEKYLRKFLEKYGGIVKIVLGLPLMEDRDFGEKLEQSLSVPVFADEESAYIARSHRCDGLVCFLAFEPEGIRFFIGFQGQLIRANGRKARRFLSYEKDVPSLLFSLIDLLSPDTVVFTGERIDKETVASLSAKCEEKTGKSGMPQFIYKESLEKDYFFGMYDTTSERR